MMKTRTHDEKIRALVAELRPLRVLFRGLASPGWMQWLAETIWRLETSGATCFGGADVFAWWLVQRAMPKRGLTRAHGRRLQRMAGRSQKCLDLLVAMAEDRAAPARFQCGWSFMRINTYMACLEAERSQPIWERGGAA